MASLVLFALLVSSVRIVQQNTTNPSNANADSHLGLCDIRREPASEREHEDGYDSKNEPRRQGMGLTVQHEHRSHLCCSHKSGREYTPTRRPDVRRNSVIVRHSASLTRLPFSITFTGVGVR
jgi:hypothetical protein